MHFRSFGIFATTLTLSANAILIPPTVITDSTSDNPGPKTLGVNPDHQLVKLECSDCPYAAPTDGGLVWTQGVENSLLIDFEVGRNQDTLSINGVNVYPPRFGQLPEPIYAHQIPADYEPHGLESFATKPLLISGLTFNFKSAETVSEDGAELLPMRFKFHSLEGQPINPPALNIFLIKDVSGRLMIASIKVEPTPATTSSPKDQGNAEEAKECKDWPLLCKWRSILADRLHGIKTSIEKGCHKGRPHGKPPHVTRPPRPHHPHHGENGERPHRHHGHHDQMGSHHRHHHKMHRFLHMVGRAIITILVPVLVGIVAGMAAYLTGWVIGRLIAFVLIKLCVCKQRNYTPVAQDEEGGDEGAKAGECEYADVEGEAPPLYEEVAEKEVAN